MELGNWPMKVQLGSTNSKGLPVLLQGSHQGFFLNSNHYLLSTPSTAGSIHPVITVVAVAVSLGQCTTTMAPPALNLSQPPANHSIRNLVRARALHSIPYHDIPLLAPQAT